MRLLKEIRNLLGNYHVKSGIYHYYRNEYKQAADFFLKALESEDENLSDSDRRTARYYLTMAFMESADRLVEKGELEEALDDFDRGVAVSPDYPDIRYRYGCVLEQLGRTDAAVSEYREAIRCNDRYLDAWVALGFALFDAGRHDESREAFTRACSLKVAEIQDPFERGVSLLASGDEADARDQFHLAFVHVPHVFREHYRTAVAMLKAEDYEGALERLEAAIDLNPTYPDLYNFRGIALLELGRLEESIDSFRRSCRMNPRFRVPRLNLAFALLHDGQFKEGEAELEAILAEDPNEPAAAAKLQEIQSGRAPENPKRRSGGRGAR